jgi:hypothetical protein
MAADRTTVEAFIADRQRFWMSFTHFLGYGALGVAVVLILMALFLL